MTDPEICLAALEHSKPSVSPEAAAFVALVRVASRFEQEMSDLLRPKGITPTQYNVLRILRGSEPAGLACGAVLDRLVARDPDITRLLDRLEKLQLVTRSRDQQDRRVVLTRITDEGRALLGELDAPVAELHRAQLGHLDPGDLGELTRLLEEVARQTR